MRKWISLFALFLTLACAKEAAVAPKTASKKASGPAMPDYKAKNLDGSEFDLKSKKGTVMLLNLWATWCGPCRFEIPELEKLHAKYAGQGFQVIGISLDESGAQAVNAYLKEKPIQYPIVLDSEGKMANILNASVLPTSVLVDRDGNMVWKSVGIVSLGDTEMTKAIEQALKPAG